MNNQLHSHVWITVHIKTKNKTGDEYISQFEKKTTCKNEGIKENEQNFISLYLLKRNEVAFIKCHLHFKM